MLFWWRQSFSQLFLFLAPQQLGALSLVNGSLIFECADPAGANRCFFVLSLPSLLIQLYPLKKPCGKSPGTHPHHLPSHLCLEVVPLATLRKQQLLTGAKARTTTMHPRTLSAHHAKPHHPFCVFMFNSIGRTRIRTEPTSSVRPPPPTKTAPTTGNNRQHSSMSSRTTSGWRNSPRKCPP